jgi:gliding motility-associated-like protein
MGRRPVPFDPEFTVYNLQFTIYDRWGEKVFTSDDISQGWDGKKNDTECHDGVYVYRLMFRADGIEEEQVMAGTVAVVR